MPALPCLQGGCTPMSRGTLPIQLLSCEVISCIMPTVSFSFDAKIDVVCYKCERRVAHDWKLWACPHWMRVCWVCSLEHLAIGSCAASTSVPGMVWACLLEECGYFARRGWMGWHFLCSFINATHWTICLRLFPAPFAPPRCTFFVHLGVYVCMHCGRLFGCVFSLCEDTSVCCMLLL